jgi:hypothetical protein
MPAGIPCTPKPSLRLITDQASYGDRKFSVALRSQP